MKFKEYLKESYRRRTLPSGYSRKDIEDLEKIYDELLDSPEKWLELEEYNGWYQPPGLDGLDDEGNPEDVAVFIELWDKNNYNKSDIKPVMRLLKIR